MLLDGYWIRMLCVYLKWDALEICVLFFSLHTHAHTHTHITPFGKMSVMSIVHQYDTLLLYSIQAFLTTLLASIPVTPWIGLQKDWSNTLLWVNNDDTTYTNFAHGEPSGAQQEKCVQVGNAVRF